VALDPDLAVKLDPSLKEYQVVAMTNGNTFVLDPPLFEIYQMVISYGCEKIVSRCMSCASSAPLKKPHCSNNFSLKLQIQWKWRKRLVCSSLLVLFTSSD